MKNFKSAAVAMSAFLALAVLSSGAMASSKVFRCAMDPRPQADMGNYVFINTAVGMTPDTDLNGVQGTMDFGDGKTANFTLDSSWKAYVQHTYPIPPFTGQTYPTNFLVTGSIDGVTCSPSYPSTIPPGYWTPTE